jgi:hypothetical protein
MKTKTKYNPWVQLPIELSDYSRFLFVHYASDNLKKTIVPIKNKVIRK